jgi:hypothetical protein
MLIRRIFLILASATVVFIALVYGISPRWFAHTFTVLTDPGNDLSHILRAVMGLYVAMGIFWLYSAFNDRLARTAVLTTIVFASGLLAGRLFSIVLDGLPSPLLAFYTVLELALIPVALWVYRRPE